MAKFNEEICNCLTELYSDGIPLKYCADAVGISRTTIYNWMEKIKVGWLNSISCKLLTLNSL